MAAFLVAYVKSMRLYYSFITGIAGWIGVAYYDTIARGAEGRTTEVPAPTEKKLVILVVLFLSWGINQIVNDFLGLKEDRINAPDRPMVTGELDARKALLLSFALLAGSVVLTWFYLEPVAIVFLLAGVLLNVVYEFAKGHGLLGNLVFGVMIAMAPLYGAYASGPTASTFLLPNRMAVLLLVVVLNGVMTFYTYFKDFEGDLAAGKRTVVVKAGIERARVWAILSAFLPTIAFVLVRVTGMHVSPLNPTFVILGLLTVFLQLWTGVLYYLQPTGERTYKALLVNFRACACGQATLIGLFDPDLAIWLFIFTYVFVGFLFELHANPRS